MEEEKITKENAEVIDQDKENLIARENDANDTTDGVAKSIASRFSKSGLGIKPVKFSKVIGRVILFVVFLIIINPSMIPFLPPKAKETLSATWGKVFGDVDSIYKSFSFNIATICQIIAIILLMVMITSIAMFVLEHLKPKTAKGRSFVTLFRSAVTYITTIIGFFWCLNAFGVNVSTIFASVGILTLVVGFGAQSLVEDLITGIFLVFEEQFNVGDIIEVGGFRGTVETIGIRITTIRDPGGNLKLVNNSDIRNILNRSSSTSVAVTEVSVAYNTDIEKVEKLFETLMPEIRKKYPDIFLEDPKYVGLQTLGNDGMVLKIIGNVKEKDIFAAPRLLNREIKIAFDKAGIEIPFPQVVVHEAK